MWADSDLPSLHSLSSPELVTAVLAIQEAASEGGDTARPPSSEVISVPPSHVLRGRLAGITCHIARPGCHFGSTYFTQTQGKLAGTGCLQGTQGLAPAPSPPLAMGRSIILPRKQRNFLFSRQLVICWSGFLVTLGYRCFSKSNTDVS